MLSNQLINGFLGCLVNLGWAVIICFTKNPIIGIFMAIMGPLSGLLIQVFRKQMRDRSHAYRSELEHMSSRVSEMIDIIPVTRAHGLEEVEVERANGYLGRVFSRGLSLDRINGLFASASFAVMYVASTVVIVGSTLLVWHGYIPLERIVLYSGLFGMIVSSTAILLGLMPTIAKGFEAVRSLGEVLECPDIEHNHGRRSVDHVRGGFEFDRVGFQYEDDKPAALIEFSLQVKPGECIAFVGESGSGKSTLMQLAIGFLRPTSGTIRLDGDDMELLDMRAWRRHVAVVPQQTLLFSGTIRENVTYGLHSYEESDVLAAIAAANLNQVIADLPDGLDTRIGENGAKLSGGQRQRIAIARAIIRNPQVIILDEATSALDVLSEHEVQEAIDNLIHGRTTFIVAHRLSTIRKADRIVVMKRGRCVEIGPQADLVAQPQSEFKRLKAMQA